MEIKVTINQDRYTMSVFRHGEEIGKTVIKKIGDKTIEQYEIGNHFMYREIDYDRVDGMSLAMQLEMAGVDMTSLREPLDRLALSVVKVSHELEQIDSMLRGEKNETIRPV